MKRRTFCQSLATVSLANPAVLAKAEALGLVPAQSASGDQEQRDALALMLKVLTPTRRAFRHGRISAHDFTWEDWQKRTGELPPKFSEMPSQPFLPNPLHGVHSKADWEKRRGEIRALAEHWMTGRVPPAPDNLRAAVTKETTEGNLTIRVVRLEFGPDHRAYLHLQLLIPRADGPRPVFLTNQARNGPWVPVAVARGYIGVIFMAADQQDDSDKYIEVYPDYDFSCLTRRAWAASRAVDYLYTLPEVDRKCIAISGHSRNGKMSLIAAAYDERITAAIPSSGNTGECNPWRYTTDPFATESIEQITSSFPQWFHPRIRFFAGREDKLPFDQNSFLSLVAPRSVLMTCSCTEEQGMDFGFEQNYRSAHEVYKFLGAPDRLGLRIRNGGHPTTAGEMEFYMDFLDSVFGRSSAPVAKPTFIFGYTFEDWKSQTGEKSPGRPGADKLRWALGDEPAQVTYPLGSKGFGVSAGWIDYFERRPIRSDVMKHANVPYGVGLKADLYTPLQHQGKLPVVVWLHQRAYSTGYSRYAKEPFEELTRRGYAVLAFDQIGYATRVYYAKDFYRRYPKWSMLGKMVADTRAAITAISSWDEIDASKLYLFGYSLGGSVALWTAALDERPAAVVSVAGVTPLRTSKHTEGIHAYSHLHGLLPRLGFYADNPASLPFDYDEVFRRIGSRNTLLVAPTHDWCTDLPALQKLAQPFSNVEIKSPDDFNRFPATTQALAFDWLDKRRV